MNKKKIVIYACVAVAVLALMAAIVIALSPSEAPSVDDFSVHIQTAQRYLVELDYDRAIAI